MERRVFPNQGDCDCLVDMLLRPSKCLPSVPRLGAFRCQAGRDSLLVKSEYGAEMVNQALIVEEQRNVICRFDVMDCDNLLRLNITVARDFFCRALLQRLYAAAGDLQKSELLYLQAHSIEYTPSLDSSLPF